MIINIDTLYNFRLQIDIIYICVLCVLEFEDADGP